MNATAPRSFSVDASLSPVRSSSRAVPKSQTGVSGQSFGRVIPLDMIDGNEFRSFFVVKFAQYLQANFRNPEAVATAFGVRHTTAVNWWNADNRASGDVVGRFFMAFPDAVAWFLQEWEGR